MVLYWELPAKQAARLVKQLRADLAGLDAEEFIALWEGADERGAVTCSAHANS